MKKGYSVADKVSGAEYTCGSDPVVIEGLTDRVYSPAEGKDTVVVTVGVGDGKSIKMTASGMVADKVAPVSCVVWNVSYYFFGDFRTCFTKAVSHCLFVPWCA